VNSSGGSGAPICLGRRSEESAATSLRESARTGPGTLPATTRLCIRARWTTGCAGSRCALTSSAPWKRWTRVVAVAAAGSGSTSTTKTVPRTAAVAFG
jgi:hypothetical protein